MKKGVWIWIIILVVIIVIVGFIAYSYMNKPKNSCSIMDDSKCNKKCNTDSDCIKAGCSCINKFEIMNISGGLCNTLVAFDCKCENNVCTSNSRIPGNNKSACGNGICENVACASEGCPVAENKDNCPEDCTASGSSCLNNSDCAGSTSCKDGVCIANDCSSDSDCLGGWYCNSGKCAVVNGVNRIIVNDSGNASGGPVKYGKCGDGKCDNGENIPSYPYYCPQDCIPRIANQIIILVEILKQ